MTIKIQPVDAGTSGASRKIAFTAGSLSALAMLPGSALAALVTVSGPPLAPVSLGFGDASGIPNSATWDIDGDTNPEFSLNRVDGFGPIYTYSTGSVVTGIVNRKWTLKNVADTAKLAGPVIASQNDVPGALTFVSNKDLLSSSMGIFTGLFGGSSLGDKLIAFCFDDCADTTKVHYGWATVNLSTAGVSITNWTYNNVAGEALHVGDRAQAVPEPSALALLALGVGGLVALRSRKRKEARSSV